MGTPNPITNPWNSKSLITVPKAFLVQDHLRNRKLGDTYVTPVRTPGSRTLGSGPKPAAHPDGRHVAHVARCGVAGCERPPHAQSGFRLRQLQWHSQLFSHNKLAENDEGIQDRKLFMTIMPSDSSCG